MAWNASTGSDPAAGGGAIQQAYNKELKAQLANMRKQVTMFRAQAQQAKQFANMQKQITMSRQARREEAAADAAVAAERAAGPLIRAVAAANPPANAPENEGLAVEKLRSHRTRRGRRTKRCENP